MAPSGRENLKKHHWIIDTVGMASTLSMRLFLMFRGLVGSWQFGGVSLKKAAVVQIVASSLPLRRECGYRCPRCTCASDIDMKPNMSVIILRNLNWA